MALSRTDYLDYLFSINNLFKNQHLNNAGDTSIQYHKTKKYLHNIHNIHNMNNIHYLHNMHNRHNMHYMHNMHNIYDMHYMQFMNNMHNMYNIASHNAVFAQNTCVTIVSVANH